ncbi:gamma-glutamyltransferase [Sphingosinicella xenopeptidilytica]|uniref:Gamma-glutamyltransferase n=1 Tax=Sphingosinicella xenopeptidilytica TaxID=364098 RepID=A0ABW3C2P6_SPHXN
MVQIGRRGLLASAAAAGLVTPRMAAAAQGSGARVAASGGEADMSSGAFGRKTPARGRGGLAITGHPWATEVAVGILREGGNACDALLAAAAAQTVIEPHLTTITGCMSMMYHDAATGRTRYLNGNVNAPRALAPVLTEVDTSTGRMACVPGFWAAFEAAASTFGTMPVPRLLKPAIGFARDGIACHPSLWGEVYSRQAMLARTAEGRSIFMPRRAILNPGEKLVQPGAAETLQRLGEEGSRWFYTGGFAKDFCAAVNAAGGALSPEEFAAYQVRWEEPVRGQYRDLEILGSVPPDTGGLHLIELLNMVELMDIRKNGPASESPETLKRMMLAARDVLVTGMTYRDPRSTPLDVERIASKAYAAERYAKILKGAAPAPGAAPHGPGSCHLTVIDRAGNIATALHSTLSLPWANGLFVHGVSICGPGNHFLNTMPKPGDRVTVLICPSMLFRGGRPFLAGGSPSTSLVCNLVQNITNIVDFGMPLAESVERPSFGGLVDGQYRMTVETDLGDRLIGAAEAAGILVERVNPWSSRHGAFEAIHVSEDGEAFACGDPRRTSVALAA